jgi:alpha-1,2-mannosyltransferase
MVFNAFGGSTAGTHAVDLTVYRDGGLIVRHVLPYYNPHSSSPLYDWGGYSALALKFTYTPFAAIAFALLSFMSPGTLLGFSIVVNMVALLVALWYTFGGLGYTGRGQVKLRLALTLLGAGVTFWLQPEVRTIYLGQVNLVLMAGIIWDLCQPSQGRWWKGFVTGIAAGIKLTPLIFIPYLLVVRRYREAAMTFAGFGFTVLVGFIILPADSKQWWLQGLIIKDGTRTGFIGWAGNQSLRAIITRLAGSVASGQDPWLVAAVVAFAVGMATAYYFDRAGHRVVAILVTALTGLLMSPISWDHHWVWVAPAVAVAGHYAFTGRPASGDHTADNSNKWRSRRVFAAVAGFVTLVVFAPWPDRWWERAHNLGNFSYGFLWAPPNTNPELYSVHGDQPWFVEYHWHGLQLVTGNAYVLFGTALLLVLAVAAYRIRRESASSPTLPREQTAPHMLAQ